MINHHPPFILAPSLKLNCEVKVQNDLDAWQKAVEESNTHQLELGLAKSQCVFQSGRMCHLVSEL